MVKKLEKYNSCVGYLMSNDKNASYDEILSDNDNDLDSSYEELLECLHQLIDETSVDDEEILQHYISALDILL